MRGSGNIQANLLFGPRIKAVYPTIWDQKPSSISKQRFEELDKIWDESRYAINEEGFETAYNELVSRWDDIKEAPLALELVTKMTRCSLQKARSYPAFQPDSQDVEKLVQEKVDQLLSNEPEFRLVRNFLIDDCSSHWQVDDLDELSTMSQDILKRIFNQIAASHVQEEDKQEALMMIKEMPEGVVRDRLITRLVSSALGQIFYYEENHGNLGSSELQAIASAFGWESYQTKTIVNSRSTWSSKDLVHHIAKEDTTVCGKPLRKPGAHHSHWKPSNRGIWNQKNNRVCVRCFKHAAAYPETSEKYYWNVFAEQETDPEDLAEFINAYLEDLPERARGYARKAAIIDEYEGALDELKAGIKSRLQDKHNNLVIDRLLQTPLSETLANLEVGSSEKYVKDRLLADFGNQTLDRDEWQDVFEEFNSATYPYGIGSRLASSINKVLSKKPKAPFQVQTDTQETKANNPSEAFLEDASKDFTSSIEYDSFGDIPF